jgi:hypothetical protein
VITARPEKSTATHNDVDAHEIPVKPKRPEPDSNCADEVHVGVAAVGFVETNARTPSTATHSPVDGQETATKRFVPSMSPGVLHVGSAAVGFVEITTLPLLSTAAHNEVDGQETLASELGES